MTQAALHVVYLAIYLGTFSSLMIGGAAYLTIQGRRAEQEYLEEIRNHETKNEN